MFEMLSEFPKRRDKYSERIHNFINYIITSLNSIIKMKNFKNAFIIGQLLELNKI